MLEATKNLEVGIMQVIETRLLYYFLTVARERNITNAARTLHITQPTLSRQMTLLEEKVGVKLFIRDSRPLSLTDEGLLLRRRAEEILELLEKTQAEICVHEEQIEGTISVGCGEIAFVKLLTEMMAEFSRKYPRVKFDVYTANTDQIKHRMDNGLTDIPVIMPSRQKVHDEVASWFGDYYEKLSIIGATNFSTNSALMVQAGMGYALIIEGGLPFLEISSGIFIFLRGEAAVSECC